MRLAEPSLLPSTSTRRRVVAISVKSIGGTRRLIFLLSARRSVSHVVSARLVARKESTSGRWAKARLRHSWDTTVMWAWVNSPERTLSAKRGETIEDRHRLRQLAVGAGRVGAERRRDL